MQSLWQQWGALLKARRGEKGLTQKEIATLAGIDQSAISGIERGAWSPSDSVRISLASALGLSVHELFPYPESQQEGNGNANSGISNTRHAHGEGSSTHYAATAFDRVPVGSSKEAAV